MPSIANKFFDKDAESGISADTQPKWAPPEPEETPAEEAPQSEEKSTAIRDYLSSRGFDVGDVDDDDLLDQMSEIYARQQNAPSPDDIREYQQAIPRLNDYAKNAAEFEAWRKQQASDEPAPKAQPDTKSGWSRLEEDPHWDSVTEWDDEASRYVPRGKYGSQTAAEERNRYHREMTERAKRLTNDPFTIVREAGLDDYVQGLREEIKKEVMDLWEQQQSQKQQKASVQGQLAQYQDKFFQFDKAGNPLRDAQGQPVMTELGSRFREAAQVAYQEFGITDEARIHAFAMREVAPYLTDDEPQDSEPEAASEPESTPKEKNQAQKRKFIDRAKEEGRAKRDSGAGASIAQAAARQDAVSDDVSWDELIKQSQEQLV